MTNIDIDAALSKLSISKDFTSKSGLVDYIHRKDGEIDLYFIRNKSNQPITDTVSFRVNRGRPELWNPITSEQYKIQDVQHENGATHIPLKLAPYQSFFIVFEEAPERKKTLPIYASNKKNKSTEVKGPWKIRFAENLGAPEQVQIDELKSWTENSNLGVKFFSGTASYCKKINISAEEIGKEKSIYLDLGEVYDLAEVFINETSAGILWTKPFIVDISDLLEAGENDLRIDITNTWVNRLSRDKELPIDKRITKTNVPYKSTDYQLQESGLLGPVKLIFSDKNENYRSE